MAEIEHLLDPRHDSQRSRKGAEDRDRHFVFDLVTQDSPVRVRVYDVPVPPGTKRARYLNVLEGARGVVGRMLRDPTDFERAEDASFQNGPRADL